MKTGGEAYLDTSVIANLLLAEQFSERAEAFADRKRSALVVSNFAAAEFSSVIARHVRMGGVSVEDARAHLAQFDHWASRAVLRVDITPEDITRAEAYMRRLDLPLRTPDAIHIAVAWRLEAELATFDRRMSDVARAVGVSVADL